MRIGINARVVDTYFGGARVYTLGLIKALKKIEPQNTYFYYTYKRNNFLKGIQWRKAWATEDNHILGDTWEQFYLPFQLIKEDIDVYHATIERLPLLKFTTKYVVTVHDLGIYIFPQFVGRKRYILYVRTLLHLAVRRADKIVVVSQNTKNDLIKILGINEKKIKVIYPGVDKEKYRELDHSESMSFVKRKYGIDKNFLLAVGLFNPKKNLHRLFPAFEIIRKKGIDKLLVVVGFRLYRYQEILDSVKEGIILLEKIPDNEMPYFFNAADLLVYPSLYEGFGLPLLEAMACGTPVVASNISSIPEVAGDAAIFFDPFNIEEMAFAIEKVLKDEELKQNLRKKGLERVKLFSWEKTAKETLDVYKSVINSRK